ncbi:2-C-methyl-D-erythritol 2,4-cyclodiphosphate synthase [Candidatus Blochmannia ocreatus (nom. nud.)]|uniref:2-C-methyl-D-erythritol 2,4-cyclodiphosphate synthase n=1 Tax=Candidatus Blochmannia ocreatus (nom. nud.) TaxID=251538 RepID=A0ABY4SZI1_9ENTR|nr:2-C-methyl-D-erythritol 2,4-cyclodiphosphate synthase [Candidatus Blochmannia ocreatus]URJ25249.1 2-C-methyl-D-erythritol 2,4-cyclodiphosphate synthase [Candidatus Blochmannia ocreatus]
MLRIGYGFDTHPFGIGRPFIIGGVRIPDDREIIAHSDGDVMIHALIDSLLGAACLGDIGSIFPDTDIQYSNIDSRKLLRIIWNKIFDQGFTLNNIDITVILQYPKINKYLSQICFNLSKDLRCSTKSINIKATTTNTLGHIGCAKGIACVTVVLLNSTVSAAI